MMYIKQGLVGFAFWAVMMIVPEIVSAETPSGGGEFPAVVEAEVRAVLAAEREGVLTRLTKDAGDSARQGADLAEIFHKDLILQKELLDAQLNYLKVQLENLERLSAKGLVTDEELARSRMELAVKSKEIQSVETTIERSVIRAPFSGVVVDRHIQPHEWVRPGQPVLEMYDPGKLRIVTDIPADLIRVIDTKKLVQFYFPALRREMSGSVKVIFPQVDVRSNTVKVHWKVEEGIKGLIPGMKGVLKIGGE